MTSQTDTKTRLHFMDIFMILFTRRVFEYNAANAVVKPTLRNQMSKWQPTVQTLRLFVLSSIVNVSMVAERIMVPAKIRYRNKGCDAQTTLDF
mmetsp:Transcript_8508/g.12540  ORF Transcript_8508/g.12540 Transcript_8508/m.12540 type:complete len:93 (-) Transcript_8508:136-414(-)